MQLGFYFSLAHKSSVGVVRVGVVGLLPVVLPVLLSVAVPLLPITLLRVTLGVTLLGVTLLGVTLLAIALAVSLLSVLAVGWLDWLLGIWLLVPRLLVSGLAVTWLLVAALAGNLEPHLLVLLDWLGEDELEGVEQLQLVDPAVEVDIDGPEDVHGLLLVEPAGVIKSHEELVVEVGQLDGVQVAGPVPVVELEHLVNVLLQDIVGHHFIKYAI